MKKLLYIILCLACVGKAYAQSGTPAEIHGINLEGKEAIENYEFEKAERLFIRALGLQDETAAGDTEEYLQTMSGLAAVYFHTQRYEQSDSVYDRLAVMVPEVFGRRSKEYAALLTNIAMSRTERQKFDGVEEMIATALDINREISGEKSAEYAATLYIRGLYNMYTGNFGQSGADLEHAAATMLGVAGQHDMTYIGMRIAQGILYFYSQDFPVSERHFNDVVEIMRPIVEHTATRAGEQLQAYITASGSRNLIYMYQGRMREAVDGLLEVLAPAEEYYGHNHPDYIAILSNIGKGYMQLGEYAAAEGYLLRTLELSKEVLGETHSHYFNALSGLAMTYEKLGRYSEAEPLFLRSLELRKQLHGPEHHSVATIMINLSSIYKLMGNYPQAIVYAREAVTLTKQTIGERSLDYALALNALATQLMAIHDYQSALPLLVEAEKVQAEAAGRDNNTYLSIQGNLAGTMLALGDSSANEVEPLLSDMMERRRVISGESHPDYVKTVNMLASLYSLEGRYDEADALFDKALGIAENAAWKNNDIYLSLLFNSGLNLESMGLVEEAGERLRLYLQAAKEGISRQFAFLSERERQLYWSMIGDGVKTVQGVSVRNVKEYPALAGLAYDCELFAKSLLLNSSARVRRSVAESGNADLARLWAQAQDNWDKAEVVRGQIALHSAETAAQDAPELTALSHRVDSLENAAVRAERELMSLSGEFARQQEEFAMTWQDVQHALGKNEAAVEYIVYHDLSPVRGQTGVMHYAALVLRPEMEYPVIIYLGEETATNTALRNFSDDLEGIYSLAWQPFAQHTDGVTGAYISPSGVFNSVPFGSIRGYAGKNMRFHNLLSTKDISTAKQRTDEGKTKRAAALLGGADFGLPAGELAAAAFPDGEQTLTRGLLDEIDPSRGQGFDYLPGSRREVEEISGILADRGWETKVFVDKSATKGGFGSLSGSGVDLIHISTHGFYFPLAGAQPNIAARTGSGAYRLSANPLMRSGLLFSGANTVWSGGELPEGADNGIMTAQEISNMDLGGTGLVVLSACDTALGDIDFSEGVYGLQRAFRLAGVKSMIVALWKIPDRETAEFMAVFYKKWTGKTDKKRAFDAAQDSMRAKYPDEPSKWAGFLLID